MHRLTPFSMRFVDRESTLNSSSCQGLMLWYVKADLLSGHQSINHFSPFCIVSSDSSSNNDRLESIQRYHPNASEYENDIDEQKAHVQHSCAFLVLSSVYEYMP